MPRGIYIRTKNIGLTPIPKVCLFCKKDFITNCIMPRKKFCSTSCRSKNFPEINLANLEKRDKEKQREMMRNRKGEKHFAWISDRNILMEKHRLRGTPEWKDWRAKVFERDVYTCQECEISGVPIEPHHIIPLRVDMKKIFEVKNGITLCRPCHQKTIREEELYQERYTLKVLTKL